MIKKIDVLGKRAFSCNGETVKGLKNIMITTMDGRVHIGIKALSDNKCLAKRGRLRYILDLEYCSF